MCKKKESDRQSDYNVNYYLKLEIKIHNILLLV